MAHHLYGGESHWSKVAYEFSDIAQNPSLPEKQRQAITTMVDTVLANPKNACDSSGWLTSDLRKPQPLLGRF